MSLVHRSLALVGELSASAVLAGCGQLGPDASGDGPRAVASFYPLAWVTEQVAGEDWTVENLTQPGQEPHDLTLDVAQTAALESADLVVLEHGFQPAVDACRARHGADAYPGSPWLLAHALRAQDRIACCELQADEAAALKANFAGDPRVAVHARDGYAAVKALLPPKVDGARYARGLVLVDPPYEAQLAEFDAALAALREGLARWPQAAFALWYPVKQRRALQPMLRRARDAIAAVLDGYMLNQLARDRRARLLRAARMKKSPTRSA